MRASSLRAFLLAAPLLAASLTHADPVDITMEATDDGQLEVKLRPNENFDGLVSSLVFTIRWDASTDAHLGLPQQAAPASAYIPVVHSGAEQDAGGDRYQIFVGFGFTALQAIPTNWVAGQEYTIMTVPVEGAAQFTLVNDSWTADNNADYYLALGGLDETGIIYQGSTTGVVAGSMPQGGLSVLPNPTEKTAVISLMTAGTGAVELELSNAAGQVVWKKTVHGTAGQVRQPLDLSAYDKGVYLLRARWDGGTSSARVVKR